MHFRIQTALVFAVVSSAAAAAPDDRLIYQSIVEQVRKGDGYYKAAAENLRANNYPLKPALAFRMPTLAVSEAALPSTLSRALALWILTAAALIAFSRSFATRSALERLSLTALAMTGLANVGAPGSIYLHEAWSVVFIVAAIAARRNTMATAALLLCATLIRETAALALIAFAIDAALSRRWHRAVAFAGTLATFGCVWLAHAHLAASAVLPTDQVSPGWLAFGGLSMIVATFNWNLLLAPLPIGIAAVVFAAAVWGSFLARNDEALRPAVIYLGLFLLCLLVFGRPDNSYWGIMISPVVLLGLVNLVPGLRHTRHALSIGSKTPL